MEADCGDPDDLAATCYREPLRTGTAPLWVRGSLDEIDRVTEKVIALAAADELVVERVWDPVVHGDAADPCPILVTGAYGDAFKAARSRHRVVDA